MGFAVVIGIVLLLLVFASRRSDGGRRTLADPSVGGVLGLVSLVVVLMWLFSGFHHSYASLDPTEHARIVVAPAPHPASRTISL